MRRNQRDETLAAGADEGRNATRRFVVLIGIVLLFAAFGAAYGLDLVTSSQFQSTSTPDLPQRAYLPIVFGQPAAPTATLTPSATLTPTATPAATSTATPTPIEPYWDPRLDQRGTILISAKVLPGQGYLRLVRGVWYAEN